MGLESDLHFRYCKSHRGVASGALEEYLNRCRRDPNWEVNSIQSERRLVTYSAQAVHSWPNRRQSLDMASSPAFAIIHCSAIVTGGQDIWCEDLTLLYMLGGGGAHCIPMSPFSDQKKTFSGKVEFQYRHCVYHRHSKTKVWAACADVSAMCGRSTDLG